VTFADAFAFTAALHGTTDRDADLARWVDRARAFVALDAAFLSGSVSVTTAATHRNSAPRQAAAIVAELLTLSASVRLDLRGGAQRAARQDTVLHPLVRDLQQIQARGKARA
jgi:predicted nucleic acid-binding protein